MDVPADAAYITGTSVDVEVNATKTGFTASSAVARSLTVDLTAPEAPTYTAPSSLKVGEAIAAMNPTGGTGIDEHGATGLPSGLSINTATGAIGGTPDTADASTASATITASDSAGNTDTVDIAFPAVAKGDQTLTGFRYGASSVTFGSTAPTVTAPSGVQTTLSYSAAPPEACTVDASSGALTIVGVGSCEITVTAEGTDDYNEATAEYTVTVQTAGTLVLSLNAIATDNTINIAEKAAGFSIGGDTGSVGEVSVTVTVGTADLTATSSTDDPATWSVDVPADAAYITGTSVDVEVNATKTGFTASSAVARSLTVDLTAPEAPTYTAPSSLKVGEAIAAMNPTGGTGIDEHGATGLPSGLSINTATGAIGGTPDTADASTASATITASDSAGNTDTVDIAFPAVAKGDQTLTGFRYGASSVTFGSTAPTVTAPSGVQTTLSYSAAPPEACTVDASSGALTIVGVGSCEITVTAEGTDDYNEATAEYTVTVQTAGTLVLSLNAIATDNTINIAEKAAGFSIGGDTGSVGEVSVTVTVGTADLTATSSTDDPATWSVDVPADAAYITGTSVDVEVNATKTGFTASSAVARSLTVDLTAPEAPTYTAPSSLKVGEAIAAMNPTGGTGIDEHGATGLPSGLSINTATGAIGGTPDTADASTASATITASDSAGNTDTVDIAFPAVAKGDQTLTGFRYGASSVTFGSTAPTVTAPSGVQTTLSYSAAPPEACTVDASSGALTIVGVGSCEITVTAEGTDDYNEATAEYTVTVQTAGTLVLSLNAIATDNTINIAEKAAGFSIGGDTGSVGSVDVTVTVGSTELTATSSTDDPATWSVDVPADAAFITGPGVAVAVDASKTGYTAATAVRRTLTVDLTAPEAPAYTAPGSLEVGVAIAAVSPSGGSGIDEYGATGLPSGLSINTATGAIGGTPDTADASTASATITASDSAGNTDTVDIAFPAVAKGDQTLTGFRYGASSVTFGSTAPTVTAPSGVQTTLSYSAAPPEACTVDASSGALALVGAGSCVITATAASTANYNEATATYTVTIHPTGTLVLNVSAIATDNTINIAEKAAGFSIGGDTGSVGEVSVTVTVGTADLTATSSTDDPATWSVDVPADAAFITGPGVAVAVDASKTGYTAATAVRRTLTVDLTAPEAPAYTAPGSLEVGVAIAAVSPSGGSGIDEYGATGLPSGLSINTATGAIGGTPDTADASTASATITASDSAGNTDTVDIAFPAVAKGDQTLTGFRYGASSVTFGSTAPTVTAPSGVQTTLSYSAAPPEACTVDASSGALALVGAGSCVITATAASTANYNEATATYTVTIHPTGTLVLNVSAIATDNTINIAEKAAGFSIGGDTGSVGSVDVTVTVGSTELTATSSTDDPATWSVDVPADAAFITGPGVAVAVDASKTGYTAATAVRRTLTVDLTAPEAPAYTAPGSLEVGVAIAAVSPSGGSGIDEYGATGLPSGLSINTATGAIGGTPDTADASTASATITASDSAGNTDTVDIAFPAVAKGDQTLTGFRYGASSVTFGSTAPTVTAPSGVQTTLSYSAAPPEACTVDASSGALTIVGVGSCEITVTAEGTDDYNEATAEYTVTVQTAGTLVLSLNAIATDNTINIAEKAAGFSIGGDTGSVGEVSVTVTVGTADLTATSSTDDPATWSVDVPADAAYITGTSVDVEVNATKTGFTASSAVARSLTVDLTAPEAPTYTAPSSLKVGEAIAAMNPTGGSGIDEHGATGLPSGLSINTATGAIGGTPDTGDASAASATVTVSDTAGNTDTVDIAFPAVAKGDQTLTGFRYGASSVAFGATAPTVTAPSGVQTTLSYSAAPPEACTVDASSGALTIVGVGSCEITVTAEGTDDYNEATAEYTVTVQTAGTLVLNVSAIATDNTINIAEKAAGFSIGGDTGSVGSVDVTVTVGSTELTATSSTDDPATWSVDVPADAAFITGPGVAVAVDASKTGYTAATAVRRTLTVDLTAPEAPAYTAPGSLEVGVAIAAVSPSGGSGIDEYGATGLPSGLSINTATGAIGGTPDTADASTASATITASDSAGNTDTVDIAFPAVAKGDQTLTGFRYGASSVTFGSTAPTVTAPSGVQTTLSYSAAPPEACTVDASSGALTIVGVGSCEITVTAEGTDDYNEATAEYTVTVQTAGTLVLSLNAIATDNTINIAEKAAGFSIGGDTGSVGEVSVTVTVGTADLTATSSTDDPATWSVDVPADAAYITGTSVDVEVNATKTGFTASSAVARSLTVDLTAPEAPTYTAPSSLKVGEAIAAMNPTGGSGIDEYGATGLPSGLSINTATGAIGGTPDTGDASAASATVTVSDTAGNTDTVDIAFPAVAKGDQTLTGFRYGASSVTFGSTAPTVTAPSGVQTTLSYSAAPPEACTVDASSGALTIVGVGSCEITVTAEGTDDYNEATAEYTVTVQTAGTLVLNVSAIATDNTINIAEKAAGFSIGGDTGSVGSVDVTVTVGSTELTATSSTDDPATWSVDVPADAAFITGPGVAVAVDASKTGYTAATAVRRTLTVDLTAPEAPAYTAPGSLEVGVAIAAVSPSGGSGIDEYGATGLPSGLSINTATGAIGGTPDTADASTASATITASDSAGNTDTVDIAFPAVAKGDQTLTGFRYGASSVTFGSTAPTVTAPSGVQTTLSYSAAPPEACTVDASSGALTIVGVGSCEITVTAEGTDDYNEATAEYTVTVQTAGTLVLSLNAIATDNTINIAEKAAGFSIGGDTGSVGSVDVTVTVGSTELTATSSTDDPATWSVDVPADAAFITGPGVAVAVDASKTGYTAATAVRRTLTVDLTAPEAPAYTAPGSLEVGVAIAAVSPSGGSGIDEYGATGLPSGLSINTATGAIGGTPDTADASTASATITASDSAGNTDTVDIAFPAVAKGDQTLTGFRYGASSVTFGSTAPTVTAPSGVQTTLSYSAAPPEACTVDASSGALALVGAGSCVITATAASTANYNEATATYTVTIHPTGTLVLNVSAIATDNTINIAEKAAGFSIGGDTGSVGEVSVTVTVGTADLTATSSTDDPATWSVDVPADAAFITGPGVAVAVDASKTGYTAATAVRRTLTVDLTAPEAPAYTAPGSLEVGVAIAAVSPSGGSGIDEYGATGLPSGLSINTATGAIGGTPDTADASTASATITASDSAGNTDTVDIAFPAVAKGDQTLTGFRYGASSVTFGSTAPTVTAPSGVQTTLSYSAAPPEACTVDASSGALALVGAGSCVITATAASTANYNEATATYTVTIHPTGTLVLNVSAIATDNTINIAEKAAGFSIGGDTGSVGSVDVTVTVGSTELTATSSTDDPATWSVDVPADAAFITGPGVAVAVDASKTGYTAATAVRRTLTVDLTAPEAPAYTAPGSLEVGVAITAVSPSGGSGIDEHGATGLPSGLSINTATGAIGGTPDTADASTASATITASDSAGNTDTVDIAFPAVAKGDQTLTGFRYGASSVTFGSTAPTVTAPSGVQTTLSYSAAPPEACTVDASSGALALVGAGSCVITATAASTANYNEATATYTVTIHPTGTLVLNVSAIATDNTINIAEKAAGFSIGGDTGSVGSVDVTVTVGSTELTATSSTDDPATWSVDVPADAAFITGPGVAVAVDASKTGYTAATAVRRTLTVDLTAPEAPAYTAPGSLEVGVAIAAVSPSGGSGIDEYGATGLPSGLSINTATGAIGGTPDTGDASAASATVTVSDTAGNTDTVDIAFPAVAKGDQTLTGFRYGASSVAFGATAPTVTAPSGVQTTLSYSAAPPEACTVDASSGALALVGAGSCVITATAASTANYNEATATYTVTIHPTGTLVLNVSAIATDNTINIAEKAAGFSIGGDTGSVGSVDVTVTVGSTELTATSSTDDPATWSVDVPADAAFITGPGVAVAVDASKTGYTAATAVRRTLTVDLTAPEAPAYTAPGSLEVGVAIAAVSPSGGSGIDEYGATGLPSGLSINTATGAIGGTPDTADASTASATITASDSAGNTDTVDIAFPAVAKGDQTLTGFRYGASSVTFGSTAPTVTAPSGVQTTLSYSAAPPEACTVDASSGALALVGAGSCVITATAASTANYNEATATYTVTIHPTGTLVLNVSAIATDNTINIAEKAAGFSIGGDTGSVGSVDVTVTVGSTELTATSSTDDPATWSVDVPADAAFITGPGVAVAVDASKTGYTAATAVRRTLTVDLTAPEAPAYTAPGSLEVGVAIAAVSPSGGSGIDEYGATGLPSGLSINTATGAIGGTPDTGDASAASATVTVSDTAGNTDTVDIAFPAVAKGDQTLTGFRYSASSVAFGATAPTVTAPTGAQTTLSYSAAPPAACTVNASSGALTTVGVGECVITATAAGTGDYNESTATYTVTVHDTENDAPVAVDDTATVTVGGSVRIDVTGNDADADDTIPDDVTVSVVSAPTNGTAMVNADKSVTYAHNGGTATADSFTYRLNDGTSDSNIATVSINVVAVNNAPMAINHSVNTLIDTPLEVDLLPLASDADGDELFYEVQPAVHGTVSIDGATVTYTPVPDFGGRDTFDYVVSDGRGGVAVGTVEVWVVIVRMARQRIVPVRIRQVAGPVAGQTLAGRLIDGDGLSATGKSNWVAGAAGGAPYFFSGSQETPVFEMDLGGLFSLRALQVGGSGEGADLGSEASSFRLEFSADGGATFGERVETVETGGLLGSGHEELPFTDEVAANWVRMTITDNAYGRGFVSVGGGDRVHLGEVGFWAGPPPVQPTQVVVPAEISQEAGEAEGEAVARRLIDSSGLSALPLLHNLYEVRHTEDPSSTRSWRTAARNEMGAYFEGDLEAPRFDVVLGRTQSLMALVVWGLGGSLDEATDFLVEFSIDGGVHYDLSTEVVRTGVLLRERSETLLFDRVHDANAVRLTIVENAHGRAFPGSEGGDRVGLGEVRFLSGPHPVGTGHILAPAGIVQTAGDADGALDATRLIDGSGLSAMARSDNVIGVEHGGESTFWRTTAASGSGSYFGGARPSPVFEVDLKDSYCLKGLVVWGTGLVSGDHAAEFEVMFSTDGGVTYGAVERVLTTAVLGAGNEQLLFSEPHAANALRITVINNAYGRGLETLTGGARVALGELRCVAAL